MFWALLMLVCLLRGSFTSCSRNAATPAQPPRTLQALHADLLPLTSGPAGGRFGVPRAWGLPQSPGDMFIQLRSYPPGFCGSACHEASRSSHPAPSDSHALERLNAPRRCLYLFWRRGRGRAGGFQLVELRARPGCCLATGH